MLALYSSFCKFGGIISRKSTEVVELGSNGLSGSERKSSSQPSVLQSRHGEDEGNLMTVTVGHANACDAFLAKISM